MIGIIIFLSIVAVAAIGFIFWLLKVLKNTLNITENVINMAQGTSTRNKEKAYDGKYYPGTVISRLEFGAAEECIITDFSAYDTHKVVCFTLRLKESVRDYAATILDKVDDMFEDMNMTDEELMKIIGQPSIFKDVVVYAPLEGVWTWKSQKD